MKSEHDTVRESVRTPGTCANEGCGRPADGVYCDACALDWSLFHREERADGPSLGADGPRREGPARG
jgi:hypothetical protein